MTCGVSALYTISEVNIMNIQWQPTYGLIVFRCDTTSIINDFDGLEAVVFKADLYSSSLSQGMRRSNRISRANVCCTCVEGIFHKLFCGRL